MVKGRGIVPFTFVQSNDNLPLALQGSHYTLGTRSLQKDELDDAHTSLTHVFGPNATVESVLQEKKRSIAQKLNSTTPQHADRSLALLTQESSTSSSETKLVSRIRQKMKELEEEERGIALLRQQVMQREITSASARAQRKMSYTPSEATGLMHRNHLERERVLVAWKEMNSHATRSNLYEAAEKQNAEIKKTTAKRSRLDKRRQTLTSQLKTRQKKLQDAENDATKRRARVEEIESQIQHLNTLSHEIDVEEIAIAQTADQLTATMANSLHERGNEIGTEYLAFAKTFSTQLQNAKDRDVQRTPRRHMSVSVSRHRVATTSGLGSGTARAGRGERISRAGAPRAQVLPTRSSSFMSEYSGADTTQESMSETLQSFTPRHTSSDVFDNQIDHESHQLSMLLEEETIVSPIENPSVDDEPVPPIQNSSLEIFLQTVQ